jgi:hypothetical protein
MWAKWAASHSRLTSGKLLICRGMIETKACPFINALVYQYDLSPFGVSWLRLDFNHAWGSARFALTFATSWRLCSRPFGVPTVRTFNIDQSHAARNTAGGFSQLRTNKPCGGQTKKQSGLKIWPDRGDYLVFE